VRWIDKNRLKAISNPTRFLKVRRSPELLETSEESGPRVTGQKQTEKLDWFST
jgi:hypothetical protein